MARTLNLANIEQKNADLCTPLFLYEVYYNDVPDIWYLAENIENVVYDGNTYQAFSIAHDTIKQDQGGRIQEMTISLANINYSIDGENTIFELIRDNELRGRKIIIKNVFADALDDDIPLLEETYYISAYQVTEQAAVFNLTSTLDVMEYYVPRRTISKELFPFIPKGRLYLS